MRPRSRSCNGFSEPYDRLLMLSIFAAHKPSTDAFTFSSRESAETKARIRWQYITRLVPHRESVTCHRRTHLVSILHITRLFLSLAWMASNIAQKWRLAANRSIFKVDMSSEPGHLLATPTAAHQPATARNMGACARCADMRKRCNMSPPYSSMKCEACDTAKVSLSASQGAEIQEEGF
ncbi:hypothetical protein DFH11DRAFT_252603 [Phellopilus nigrolimitatus]|nr:hypothetical protein DFH11DRAFT_252603 [Phellopilus nigrolimitatus]